MSQYFLDHSLNTTMSVFSIKQVPVIMTMYYLSLVDGLNFQASKMTGSYTINTIKSLSEKYQYCVCGSETRLGRRLPSPSTVLFRIQKVDFSKAR